MYKNIHAACGQAHLLSLIICLCAIGYQSRYMIGIQTCLTCSMLTCRVGHQALQHDRVPSQAQLTSLCGICCCSNCTVSAGCCGWLPSGCLCAKVWLGACCSEVLASSMSSSMSCTTRSPCCCTGWATLWACCVATCTRQQQSGGSCPKPQLGIPWLAGTQAQLQLFTSVLQSAYNDWSTQVA